MKNLFLCALMLATGTATGLAQYSIEVNSTGKKTVIPASEVRYVDFKDASQVAVVDLFDMTVLSKCVIFKLAFAEDVAGYHASYTFRSTYKEKPDSYWVSQLKNQTKYGLEEKPLLANVSYPNTYYVLLLLPVDKNGNYGQLVAHEFKSKDTSSQPLAKIVNFVQNANSIQWEIQSERGAASYLMFVNVGDTMALENNSDVAVAHYMLKNKDIMPVWTDFSTFNKAIGNNDSCIEIYTWAMDAKGKMSGLISKHVVAPQANSAKKAPDVDDSMSSASRRNMAEWLPEAFKVVEMVE